MAIHDLVEEYAKACDEVESKGSQIVEWLKPIIESLFPDLEVTLGTYDLGSDFICVTTRSFESTIDRYDWSEDKVGLEDVIEKFFPRLEGHLDMGELLSKDEASKLSNSIEKELERDKNE